MSSLQREFNHRRKLLFTLCCAQTVDRLCGPHIVAETCRYTSLPTRQEHVPLACMPVLPVTRATYFRSFSISAGLCCCLPIRIGCRLHSRGRGRSALMCPLLGSARAAIKRGAGRHMEQEHQEEDKNGRCRLLRMKDHCTTQSLLSTLPLAGMLHAHAGSNNVMYLLH